MVEVLFGVLLQGLKLANSKESTKYLDEVLKLQKDWLNEYKKPRKKPSDPPSGDYRSNASLDELELRLELISKQFANSFKS